MKNQSLSKLQRKILKLIVTSVKRRGSPPTVREIAKYCGFSSVSSAHYHINKIRAMGYLRFRYNRFKRSARGLKVLK